MTKKIFESAHLGTLNLKNRLVRSATWEGIAAPNGAISQKRTTSMKSSPVVALAAS